MKITGGRRSS